MSQTAGDGGASGGGGGTGGSGGGRGRGSGGRGSRGGGRGTTRRDEEGNVKKAPCKGCGNLFSVPNMKAHEGRCKSLHPERAMGPKGMRRSHGLGEHECPYCHAGLSDKSSLPRHLNSCPAYLEAKCKEQQDGQREDDDQGGTPPEYCRDGGNQKKGGGGGGGGDGGSACAT